MDLSHRLAPELPDFRCPDLPPELNLRLLGLNLDLLSLVIGIFLGLVLWPVFELLYLWQAYLKAQIRGRLRRPPSQLYKILE